MCVCVCEFLDLWMLCIYVELSFKSLICHLDVWLIACLLHSSLCVFHFLKKNLFSSSSTLLDTFSTKILSIETPFCDLDRSSITTRPIENFPMLSVLSTNPWQILDASRFLGYFSIDSRQLIRSIETNLCALYLLDRFLIDPRSINTIL